MIYYFNLKNDLNELKSFYLTADNHSQLYKRIMRTYGIPKDRVEILEEYEETEDYNYRLYKSNIKHLTDKDKELAKKAREIFANSTRKCEPYKSDYIKKYNYKDVININSEGDLIPLLNNYKKIKVYWELTDKRGVHQYYALVK